MQQQKGWAVSNKKTWKGLTLIIIKYRKKVDVFSQFERCYFREARGKIMM